MQSLVRGLSLGIMAAVLLAGVVQGQDKEKKPVKKDPYAGMFTFGKAIKLDDKQKDEMEKLQKEYSPKLADLDKKKAAIIPADRLKAANEAKAKAAKDGVKGKELDKAYQDVLKATDEEKKQLAAVGKEIGALQKEIGTKKMALLTDEQKEALKPKKKK